ncbi:MAG: hypothetical protein C4K60_01590 [Ideonella sp. MAG2]|nr:MAG: hypothetical protein C4K60_01590 [Ideonella sp. MAG2]
MSTSSSSKSGWTTLIWSVVGLLAALWSGGAWLLGGLLSWVVDTASVTPAADWAAVFKTWEPPPWLVQLSAWMGWGDVAQWQGLAQALMEGLATTWPWLGEALSWLKPVVVILWVIGLLVLLVLGGLVHAWVRWMIRQSQPRPASSQVPA